MIRITRRKPRKGVNYIVLKTLELTEVRTKSLSLRVTNDGGKPLYIIVGKGT